MQSGDLSGAVMQGEGARAVLLAEETGEVQATTNAFDPSNEPTVAASGLELLSGMASPGLTPLRPAEPVPSLRDSLIHALCIVASVGVGAVGPIQGGANVRLGLHLGSGVSSSFVM